MAPAHIVESGILSEALLAYVAVSKYGDGLPLYRQEAIFLRDHVEVDRGLMARWMAEAIRYTLSRWEGLTRFIDDGRIEIDSNIVERSIRPIALNRKNALCAGSDAGAEHWATIASLIETAKLNDVEPLGYLADVLTKIVNGHPNSQIDELLPWSYGADKMLPIKQQAWSVR